MLQYPPLSSPFNLILLHTSRCCRLVSRFDQLPFHAAIPPLPLVLLGGTTSGSYSFLVCARCRRIVPESQQCSPSPGRHVVCSVSTLGCVKIPHLPPPYHILCSKLRHMKTPLLRLPYGLHPCCSPSPHHDIPPHPYPLPLTQNQVGIL